LGRDRHPETGPMHGQSETWDPKVKLSAVRFSHRTIASMPSTSMRPPRLVRVSVEALTPIAAATCAQDIPRARRWASSAA
jgi:hypothetical protein